MATHSHSARWEDLVRQRQATNHILRMRQNHTVVATAGEELRQVSPPDKAGESDTPSDTGTGS